MKNLLLILTVAISTTLKTSLAAAKVGGIATKTELRYFNKEFGMVNHLHQSHEIEPF